VTARSAGRAGRPWRRHRQRLVDSDATICAWPPCSQPVDKTLPGNDPWGPTANHIDAIMLGGDPLGPIELMHNVCNVKHGHWVRKQAAVRASRDW
jgi:hypothetical protein